MYRLAQNGTDLHRLAQTCIKRQKTKELKHFWGIVWQTCTELYRPEQTCTDLHKLAQTCIKHKKLGN